MRGAIGRHDGPETPQAPRLVAVELTAALAVALEVQLERLAVVAVVDAEHPHDIGHDRPLARSSLSSCSIPCRAPM
jgi:hypothetical protein